MRMMMKWKKGRSRKTKEEPNTASTGFSATDVSSGEVYLFFSSFFTRN